MVMVFTSPLLTVIAASSLAVAAISLIWLIQLSKRHESPPDVRAWEPVADAPRSDLAVTDVALDLGGPDYEHIGNMPANFVCAYCGTPEDIELKLYHHRPTRTVVLLSRHHCRGLNHFLEADTVEMPVMQGGNYAAQADAVQDPSSLL